MKKKLLAFVLILMMMVSLTPVSAMAREVLRQAPVNPDYLKWLEDGRVGEMPSYRDLDYLAASYDRMDIAGKADLPSSYDLRDYGKTPPVVNQNPNGTCWACAATGSATSILKPTASYQFSPVHLAWFNFKGAEEEAFWGAVDDPLNYGGNNIMATGTMAAWKGPVGISRAPLPGSKSSPPSTSLRTVADYHLQDSWWLEGDTTAIRAAAKQIIMEEGAMTIHYYHDDKYLNTSNYAFNNTYNTSTNHAVLVVGWNDSYSRYNFKSGYRPSSNGAWLVQNSWGSSWGNNGYMWISYEDTSVRLGAAYFVESADNYQTNYQHDRMGSWSSIGIGSTSATAANVFAAKSNEQLEAVGLYTTEPGASYKISIYTGITAGDPDSGVCHLAGYSGTELYAGYHTIELPAPIPLNKGELFSVVVTFTNPKDTYVIPIEGQLNTTTSDFPVSVGESYVALNGGWEDLGASYPSFSNVCIKAFTNPRSATPKYTVTLPSGTGYTAQAASGSSSPVTSGGSYSFTVTLQPGYAKGSSFAVKANGVTLTESGGKYTISNITANQTVTVTGVVEAVKTYTVTLPTGTGYVAEAVNGSASPVTSGGSFSFIVTLQSGYVKGADFAVKANGVTLTPAGSMYTISNITANQTVTVTGVAQALTVTLTSGTGYTLKAVSGSVSPVAYGGSYSFTLTTQSGYDKGYSFAVMANGKKLKLQNGQYTIANITGSQVVTVTGIEKAPTNAQKVRIPAETDVLGVESFRHNNTMYAVVCPSGMTIIGAKAFADCANLTRVYVPDSVTLIAPDALKNSPKAFIVCNEGTYAQTWAEACGIPWVTP